MHHALAVLAPGLNPSHGETSLKTASATGNPQTTSGSRATMTAVATASAGTVARVVTSPEPMSSANAARTICGSKFKGTSKVEGLQFLRKRKVENLFSTRNSREKKPGGASVRRSVLASRQNLLRDVRPSWLKINHTSNRAV